MRGGGLVPVLSEGPRDEDKNKAPSPLHHRPLSLHLVRHLQTTYPCKASPARTLHGWLSRFRIGYGPSSAPALEATAFRVRAKLCPCPGSNCLEGLYGRPRTCSSRSQLTVSP